MIKFFIAIFNSIMYVMSKISMTMIREHFRIRGFQFHFYIYFLGPHPWHMEVPRLGVKLELQLPSYTRATAIPHPSLPVAYATAPGNVESLTHRGRPGIKPTSSWILVRFVTCWDTMGTMKKIVLINNTTYHIKLIEWGVPWWPCGWGSSVVIAMTRVPAVVRVQSLAQELFVCCGCSKKIIINK